MNVFTIERSDLGVPRFFLKTTVYISVFVNLFIYSAVERKEVNVSLAQLFLLGNSVKFFHIKWKSYSLSLLVFVMIELHFKDLRSQLHYLVLL